MLPFIVILSGAILCATGTWLIQRWFLARGFVDRPGGHKGHTQPVVLGGGVAVTLAVVVPMLAGLLVAGLIEDHPPEWFPADLAPHLKGIVAKTPLAIAIVVCAGVMCLVGLADDRRPLPVTFRLAVQLIIALALVVGFDLRLLSHLPDMISMAVSVLWILTLTNAMNFLDNMDGLSTGVATIAAAVFGIAATLAGQIFVPTCCWLIVGALLGFLPFNFHPARIYLGDAGSTVIGFLLAVMTILTTFVDPAIGPRPFGVITPLVVMAVPLYDTGSVFFLRWRSGIPIWTGDRRHFSHRLLRRGMTVPKAVLVIWLATLVTSLPALILPKVDSWFHASVIMAQTLLVVALVAILESSGPHAKAPTKP